MIDAYEGALAHLLRDAVVTRDDRNPVLAQDYLDDLRRLTANLEKHLAKSSDAGSQLQDMSALNVRIERQECKPPNPAPVLK